VSLHQSFYTRVLGFLVLVLLEQVPRFYLSEISNWVTCLAIILSLGTFGVTFLALVVMLVVFKWKATIITTPAVEGGTRLTVNGSHPETTKILQMWVEEDLRGKLRPV